MKELYQIILKSSRVWCVISIWDINIPYVHNISNLSDQKYFYLFQNRFNEVKFSRRYGYKRLYEIYLDNPKSSYYSYDMSRRPHDTHDLTYWNLFRFCCRKGYIDIIKILLRRCIPYWDVCKYITIDNINTALDDKRYKTVLFLISRLLYIDNNHVDKLFQEVYNYHSQQYKILKLLLCNVSTSTILECFDKSFNVSVYYMIAKHKPHLFNRSLKRRYQKYLKMKNI